MTKTPHETPDRNKTVIRVEDPPNRCSDHQGKKLHGARVRKWFRMGTLTASTLACGLGFWNVWCRILTQPQGQGTTPLLIIETVSAMAEATEVGMPSSSRSFLVRGAWYGQRLRHSSSARRNGEAHKACWDHENSVPAVVLLQGFLFLGFTHFDSGVWSFIVGRQRFCFLMVLFHISKLPRREILSIYF